MEGKTYVTMDGNEAAAHIAYTFTEIAAIYPITPSSPMAGRTDAWSARGRLNLFGQPVTLMELQSEAGAIGAIHGAAQTGALATTYTSSQGLLLMIPVLHRIAGERLPVVLHVAARTIGTHAMSIFGDHSDVMCCRNTGLAMLCSGSVQEIADLAAVAHLSAIKGRIPFLHFFDGFRTSHELNKVELPDSQALVQLLDRQALNAFKAQALNPEHPRLRSTVQNGDIYFQVREANNQDYQDLPDVVEDYLAQISQLTGRTYHLFNYYGAPDATEVVVAMGSVSGAIEEAVDYLNQSGRKVGFIQVHLYRPFSVKHFLQALPETVKKIAVLDRCKEMGSTGEPLYQDICTAFSNSGRAVTIFGGRYGLSSKDTDPAQIVAVFDNLLAPQPIQSFTIGITDDVTHLSLPVKKLERQTRQDLVQCKFWGLGSDGTVGANHNTVEIINQHTSQFAQAYFEYDAKKSFGITKSHLRFGPRPMKSSYFVKEANFIACHNPSFIGQYDIIDELQPGGIFLLNCPWSTEELETHLPASVKRQLAQKHVRFYTIDASAIARDLGLGSHINTILQAAFFALSSIIPMEDALQHMKQAVYKTYYAKGDEVIAKNNAAIDRGATAAREVIVPTHWAQAQDPVPASEDTRPAVVRNILEPINRQKGDTLPVSTFLKYLDGTMDMGMTAWEKRNIAVRIPKWDAEKCLQCNLCSLVCPHAVIRPYLLDAQEEIAKPEDFVTVPAKGQAAQSYTYSLQISGADCTGCGICANTCPAKDKALTMVPAQNVLPQDSNWAYALSLGEKPDVFDPYTIKGSQFRQPLVEFSAACAGCGETPYAKLLTQLFGDRVYWANATGCSQAWGSPMPGIPYTINKQGRGPAWSNSLFEDNAEFSLGMFLSVRQQRAAQKMRLEKLSACTQTPAIKEAIATWMASFQDIDRSLADSDTLVEVLRTQPVTGGKEAEMLTQEILQYRDQLSKKCFWMFGGDGWAYDIGFGGLDHVIATGEDVNVFIVDTEVYSNTGGQSSKATPLGAVAQFCSSGKKTGKKDLGAIMMTYEHVYVAQVAMGANPNQLIQAVREAEAFPGPSVIIAYTPCSAHGIRFGMDKAQEEMKRAVDAGYWTLYRYNPAKAPHPLTLDSKAPSLSFGEFLDGEVRYASLKRTFPDNAQSLFAQAEKDARARYEKYAKLAGNEPTTV